MAQAVARARDDDGAPEGGVARPLGLEEATRRPPSMGLVAKIVGLTILGAGAVFSFGMAWGRSTEDGTALVRELRKDLTSVVQDQAEARHDAEEQGKAADAADAAQDERLKMLERVAGGLTPAVDRLTVQVEKLGTVVDTLRATVTEQVVELRYMKESMHRLEGIRDPREAAPPAAPTAAPR